jgi:hypothetical protein
MELKGKKAAVGKLTGKGDPVVIGEPMPARAAESAQRVIVIKTYAGWLYWRGADNIPPRDAIRFGPIPSRRILSVSILRNA